MSPVDDWVGCVFCVSPAGKGHAAACAFAVEPGVFGNGLSEDAFVVVLLATFVLVLLDVVLPSVALGFFESSPKRNARSRF